MGKLAEDKRDTRAAVLGCLMAAGNRAELAGLYADAYLEYREAVKSLQETGAIVQDPRTGAAMENPYLKVRDRAFNRLQVLKKVRAGDLW